mgnify:CR=1 FL=1|jgi:hypothetical protein
MIQNSKGTQKETLDKNKASQNMPWWVEATRCLFPIATEIPQHVGRRKRRAAVLPPIHLLCLFQFYFGAAVFHLRVFEYMDSWFSFYLSPWRST